MNGKRNGVPTTSVFIFFLLTFVISWSAWIPMVFSGKESMVLRSIGTFGPLLSALILTALREGRTGLRDLFRKFLIWRVSPAWYAVALLSTAVLVLAALGIHRATGGAAPRFHDVAELYLVIPIFAYVLFFSVLGEETGWRGYAQPKLQKKWGALGASLAIGLVWGVWHLPLFWIPGNFHGDIPLTLFILQDIALSVVLAWLYNSTGGSLLIVHLLHAASNTTLGILPILPQDTGGDVRPLWIAVGLLCALAFAIAVKTGAKGSGGSGDNYPGSPKERKPKNTTRARTVGTLLAVGILVTGCASSPIDSDSPLDRYVDHLDSQIPRLMDRFDVPGVAIALIVNGRLEWAGAYGYADLQNGRPMSVDSICRAESISKSVTAWGVMRLVEAGVIGLDDPVHSLLGDWRLPQSPYPVELVTVRQLLSHTGGMPLGEIGEEYRPNTSMPSLRDHLTHAASAVRNPGSGFIYSNVGYNLLELLVESVTERDFADYMATEVFEPLGMDNATFTWSDAFADELPFGYEQDGNAVAAYVYPAAASGGLFANVEDIGRFVAAGMRGPLHDATVSLSEESIVAIHTVEVDIPGLFGVVADGYGFGHFVEELPDGRQAVWHGGQGHGWMTHFHSVPESGEGIVILTNSRRSWPFIALVLDNWAEWAGIRSVKMSRISSANTALRVMITVSGFIGLWLLYRLIHGIRVHGRRFAPLSRIARPKRMVQTALGAAVIGALGWAVAQPYLFVSSIFLDAAVWGAAVLLLLASLLIAYAMLPLIPGKGGKFGDDQPVD